MPTRHPYKFCKSAAFNIVLPMCLVLPLIQSSCGREDRNTSSRTQRDNISTKYLLQVPGLEETKHVIVKFFHQSHAEKRSWSRSEEYVHKAVTLRELYLESTGYAQEWYDAFWNLHTISKAFK